MNGYTDKQKSERKSGQRHVRELINEARRLAELAKKATPGPWKAVHRCIGAGPDADELGGLGWEIEGPPEPMRGQFSRAADAHLVASAPEMAKLLGEIADALEEVCS